jgi:hypothetical protein
VDNVRSSPGILRTVGDPLADRVVTELLDSGQIAHANQVLHGLRTNDQSIPADLPDVLREYLTATNPVPDWVDAQRIARVHRFFQHDGVHVVSALSLAGMVHCYANPSGAKLLHTTHRLDHPHRRLSETTQFLLHMMAEDPFGGHGRLVPTIQKVRLIHAAVRQLLIRDRHWDVAACGVPICQDDLLGATLIFSVSVLEGMARVGVHCTTQEAEDYYYTWRVVGVMLGVQPDVIPESLSEAQQLWTEMRQRYLGPSVEGVQLTHNLLELYRQVTPPGMHGAIPAMVRGMVGTETADWMEVPATRWEHAVAEVTDLENRVGQAEDHHVLARRVLDRVGQLLLRGEVRRVTHGQSVEFDIPEGFGNADDPAVFGAAP